MRHVGHDDIFMHERCGMRLHAKMRLKPYSAMGPTPQILIKLSKAEELDWGDVP